MKIFKKSVKAQKTAFEDPLKKMKQKVKPTLKSVKHDIMCEGDGKSKGKVSLLIGDDTQ
ncbi:hypothetical protein [Candidatus Bartonella washoeensis]|uniref:hypothetical protein n=1 Tax=Candidatus Bartonella washoeensis TaxID=186739 RepID=UPI000300B02C|nr:hypothetical protein [Bartonella washoeensis]